MGSGLQIQGLLQFLLQIDKKDEIIDGKDGKNGKDKIDRTDRIVRIGRIDRIYW